MELEDKGDPDNGPEFEPNEELEPKVKKEVKYGKASDKKNGRTSKNIKAKSLKRKRTVEAWDPL